MSTINIHRVVALPSQLEPHSLYIVRPSPFGLAELVFTTAEGAPVQTLKQSDVETLIASSLGKTTSLQIAFTIADRNALQLEGDAIIYVVDASGDPAVGMGGGLYAYKHNTFTYTLMVRTAGGTWNGITGRPNSSPEQIDDAVQKAHSHENSDVLNALSEKDGKLQFRGQQVATIHLDNVGW